jgi:hypothetical protein
MLISVANIYGSGNIYGNNYVDFRPMISCPNIYSIANIYGSTFPKPPPQPPKSFLREVADTTLDKDLWMAENQSTGKGGGI